MKQHPQQRHGVFSSFILLGTVLLGISRMMMPCHAACSSCLVSTAVPFLLQHHHHHPPSRRGWTPTGATRTSAAPFGIMVARHVRSRISKLPQHWRLGEDATSEETTNDETEAKDHANNDKDKDDSATTDGETFDVTSASMVFAIGLYKNFISPLLPPACRFLPTCSQYGVQAIEDFGPSKGGILTAWRILRCSPVGGRGYDPPKWPPVAYNYASY